MVSITVSIPTYKQSDSIERAIESVLSQDFDDIELIVNDDAPDDNCYSLVKKYEKLPNFRYNLNSKNLGLVANYRQGLMRSNGKLFINLDGDDYLSDRNFFRKAHDLMAANPKAVALIGGQEIRSNCGKLLRVQRLTRTSCTVVNGSDFFAKCISDSAPVIPHLGTMIRADVAKSINYYSADLINTDLHSVRRLFLKGDVLLIGNICGVWNYGASNTSTSFSLERHTENVRCLVEPFAEAIETNFTDRNTKEDLKRKFVQGLKKYHRDIYSICLRGDAPVQNIWSYFWKARKFDYFESLEIGRSTLIPNLRVLRNVGVRMLLGRTNYIYLANKHLTSRKLEEI